MCIFGRVRGLQFTPQPFSHPCPRPVPRHPSPCLVSVLSPSEAVQSPAVETARRLLLAATFLSARGVQRCELVAKLLSESQLVVIVLQLRRLHEATDLRSPVQVCLLLGSVFFLLLHLVQLGIVSSVLLHGDEEVTQVKPELVVLRVEREQPLDKGSDLWPEQC